MAPPKTDTKPVLVRFPEAVLDTIDDIRRTDKNIPSRPEVVRQIVQLWLTENPGVIPGQEARG